MVAPTKNYSNAGRDAGFLASEAAGRISREQSTLAGPRATDLLAGTVLGRAPKGAVTVTAAAAVSGQGGTPGNGTVTALTADAGAPAGVWQIVILNPATNAGAFEVRNPSGGVDGNGTVGVPFNGTINFTLNDGSVDFSEDDRIAVTVAYAASTGRVAPLSLNALDDSQIADTILLLRQPAGTAPKRAAVVARQCEVIDNLLIWPSGITPTQKATAIAQLALKGIIVRLNV